MKKPWIIAIVCLVVSMLICLAVSWPQDQEGNPQLPDIWPNSPTKPVETTESTETTQPPIPGKVCLYLPDAAQAQAMQQLAQQYQALTGTVVEVVVDDAENATILSLQSRADVQLWKDRLLDLSGSAVLGKLYQQDFALTEQDKPIALAMDITAYGLIYHSALLAEAGYTRTDILDFAGLQVAVEHISEQYSTLRAYAFGTVNVTDQTFISQLLGLSDDPAAIRAFLDLYIQNDSTKGEAKDQFVNAKVVFYLGGVWEYEDISELGIWNIDILPAYTPDGNGLSCICSQYWGVNSQAATQDIQASLDFLDWLVTAPEGGAAPIDSMGYYAPFVDATAAENIFMKKLRTYLAGEPVQLVWAEDAGVNKAQWLRLSFALSDYVQNPSEETWARVEELLP